MSTHYTSKISPPGSITIFSKPLFDDEDSLRGFYLRHFDGALWLRGYSCSNDYHWAPHDRMSCWFLVEKLEARPFGRGLFVSYAGFTAWCLDAFARGKPTNLIGHIR